ERTAEVSASASGSVHEQKRLEAIVPEGGDLPLELPRAAQLLHVSEIGVQLQPKLRIGGRHAVVPDGDALAHAAPDRAVEHDRDLVLRQAWSGRRATAARDPAPRYPT